MEARETAWESQNLPTSTQNFDMKRCVNLELMAFFLNLRIRGPTARV